MNKKTNKTAHVMSILTKNANSVDKNSSTVDGEHSYESSLNEENTEAACTISNNVKLGLLDLLSEEANLLTPPTVFEDIDSTKSEDTKKTTLEDIPISPQTEIKATVEDISISPQTEIKAIVEDIPVAILPKKSPVDFAVSSNYIVAPTFSNKPSYDAPPAPTINHKHILQSDADIALIKNVKDFTPELFFDPDENDRFPERYFSEKEENKMSNYDPTNTNSKDEHYICVNVVEEITAAMLSDVMLRFDLCQCSRCKADVMAIALNDLTPKYVGTHKGQLYVKLAGYEKQYSTDVLSALTKACIFVKSNPRH